MNATIRDDRSAIGSGSARSTPGRRAAVVAGYELGTGEPVAPPAHTFVAGQTQLSGKTTLLHGITVRSGRRALAFVTKRGEEFAGRRIRPYLPREGDRPIHWRTVETILASAPGERKLKYERYWIIQAAKGAKSLEDVRRNVARLGEKAKANAKSKEAYELIGEYLDLVLPEMRELDASDALELEPGLNVMDLVGHGPQLQAMVIQAGLARINAQETDVLTVFPEAWEFAPRGRVTPSSAEAVNMARKGAVLGNYLLCDSQDIAGVDTVLRQASSVWYLGVQLELNELARTLRMIPAHVKKPRAEEVTSLKLGQFIACWSGHAVRMFAQPAWMSEADARAIARGEMAIGDARPIAVEAPAADNRGASRGPRRSQSLADFARTHIKAPLLMPYIKIVERMEQQSRGRSSPAAPTFPQPEPVEEDDMSAEDVKAIRESIGTLAQEMKKLAGAAGHAAKTRMPDNGAAETACGGACASVDAEQLYEFVKAKLMQEAPALIKVLADVPEISVTEEKRTIETSTSGKGALMGRLALMIADGWFDEPRSDQDIRDELKRYGLVAQKSFANVTYASNKSDLVKWGFLFIEAGNYQANPRMLKQIKRV